LHAGHRQASAARQTQQIAATPRQQSLNVIAHVCRGTPEVRELPLGNRALDQRPLGSYPDTTAGQIRFDIRNDSTIRRSNETD
jgi:hypothetical protein|tara:strand:+ start:2076 stop:2324 length:249 start_codon:yes stop_codon:yes gene_type:complete